MAHLTGVELYDMQYDNLWESTADNPQLKASSVASRNKALNTSNKRIIGAVNEILKGAQSVDNSMKLMSNQYNGILGDFGSDETLVTKLKEVDENIILAIYKLYTDLKSVTSRLESLESGEGNTGEACSCDLAYAEDSFTYTDSPIFQLSHTKIKEDDFEFLINGIEYEMHEAFTLDCETGTVTWIATEEDCGFTLDSDFEIRIQYWYEK